MKRRGSFWMISAALAVLVTSVGCSKQDTAPSSRIEEKTISVTLARPTLEVDFLAGQLKEPRVLRSVNADTGEVVAPPTLRATLTLKNTSADRAARLLGGRVEYVDASGQRIPLADGRGDTEFSFSYYGTERLDPGREHSQDINVPFPAAALDGRPLADLRLRLTYLPIPYRTEIVTLPASTASTR